MADAASDRRPRRRAASKTAQPSAVHYLGYVEDEESPEMIMKKFEELAKIEASLKGRANLGADIGADAPACDKGDSELGEGTERNEAAAGLTEEQMMEVFKQTSSFTVRSVLNDNDVMMADDSLFDALAGDSNGFGDGEIDEVDEDDFWGEGVKRTKRAGSGRAPRMGGVSAQHYHMITSYSAAQQMVIRRKVRVEDPDARTYVQVPSPLPLSWGRSVRPYVPSGQSTPQTKRDKPATRSGYYDVENLEDLSLSKVAGRDFQGVLVNTEWEMGADGQTLSRERLRYRLEALELNKVCPTGFIFIWAHKEHIMDVMAQLYRWRYVYVENLTWVQMQPNNTVVRNRSRVLQRSHRTLFVFRKDGAGKDIELRHQRNPDVVQDYVRAGGVVARPSCPQEVYTSIETLLPGGGGKFLELWAPHRVHREGWVHYAVSA